MPVYVFKCSVCGREFDFTYDRDHIPTHPTQISSIHCDEEGGEGPGHVGQLHRVFQAHPIHGLDNRYAAS